MTTQRAPSKIIPRAFPGIKPDEIEEIIVNSQIRSYPEGTVICHEGATERTFYMILEGELSVSKVINNDDSRLLKTLTAGDYFGEMALIHNASRAATVVAKTNVLVLELSKEGFDRVLRQSPSVSLAMVREISSRLRQNDDLAIEYLKVRAGELALAYEKLAEEELARRTFLTNIAHELRTPLMAANGYLQLLKKGMLSGEQLDQATDTISRNLGQIIALVNDALFLQETELVLPEFQDVDMVSIVAGVFEQYKEKAGARDVKLKVKADRGLPHVSGDHKSLERAVIALVDNAIKFSPHGGDVNIRLSARNGNVLVEVEDHGIGMTSETRQNIFDRFYHLDRAGDELFGGIGLGLAITNQVIKQHHGKLEVKSGPAKGSTFTMSLPAMDRN